MPDAPAASAPALEAALTLAVDDHTIAKALDISVDFVRKDRRTKRLLPFVRIGGRVRYIPQHVLQKLAELEEGGVRRPRGRGQREAG